MPAGDRPELAAGQIVTVFRSRRRQGSEADYDDTVRATEEAARAQPGFVDYAVFAAVDGERVSIITFATPEAQAAWRDDARHRAAQKRGRNEFYDSYSLQVGECRSATRWDRPPD